MWFTLVLRERGPTATALWSSVPVPPGRGGGGCLSHSVSGNSQNTCTWGQADTELGSLAEPTGSKSPVTMAEESFLTEHINSFLLFWFPCNLGTSVDAKSPGTLVSGHVSSCFSFLSLLSVSEKGVYLTYAKEMWMLCLVCSISLSIGASFSSAERYIISLSQI